jgi:glycosyltransferase involved in cell wall biosynthesis
VAQRIARYYRRQATVIHPPVDTAMFKPGNTSADFYLMVTALVPYKGVEVAIRAFQALRRPLKIIGSGPLAKTLTRLAGDSVELLGWRSNEELCQYYAACRAVIFPTLEDFGIVPLEANAAGRPVIALGQGGALETVVPANDPQQPLSLHPRVRTPGNAAYRPTGVFFAPRTPEALQAAVQFFEAHETLFCPEALRQHALQFDRERFKSRIHHFLTTVWERHRDGPPSNISPL